VQPDDEDEDEDEIAALIRQQEEEMRRIIEEEEEVEEVGIDHDSSALLGLLKTARGMCRLGMYDMASNINSYVRSKIGQKDASHIRIFRKTSESLSAAARQLAGEGKSDEAEEINLLASSYRKKYEKESGG